MQYGLVIDGKTLAFALEEDLEKKFLMLAGKCNSVICCRSSPIQKVKFYLCSFYFHAFLFVETFHSYLNVI